ncbi:amidase [Blastococcus sp. Marseille-P5729]|uniref:amidase n=1 Tax=Blastococcus sp. Marseille-P5729 TaxID=2086582 RepID=UPI000D0E4E8D|nr:amidase [Blastococcus sp. Marseille-P5729]
MDDVSYLSAAELSTAYAAGELSPVEATRGVLDRLHEVNDKINAFTAVLDDYALDHARQSEERWRAGSPLSPIDGVPTSIKDNVPMAGLPCRRGSLTTDPGPASENGPAVDRLLEAGAVLFGRTTLPDNACKGVTDSPLTGITRNPWNLQTTPGGSSGGASAALAAGIGPLALGSDGAGSIRIPASFAGVAGIKQTYGRVATLPGSPFEGMSHQGPMARTVADVGLMLQAIAHPDPRDGTSWPGPPIFDPDADITNLNGVRIAFTADFDLPFPMQQGVRQRVVAASDVFRSLGATVVDACPDLSGVMPALATLWHGGLAKVYAAVPESARDRFDPALVAMAQRGAGITAADYVAASGYKAELGRAMGEFHREHDLLVGPTMPLVAFEAGRLTPPGTPEDDWMTWSPYVAAFNMTQQPAASVPCGLSDGLPVGLQIIGRRNDDALVLRAAAAYEQAAGGFRALSDHGRRLAL